MQRMACLTIALGASLILSTPARTGDRAAVTEQLDSLTAAWPDALFSIDVRGADDGNAVLNQRLEIDYEAAVPGYLAYVRVSSHGDVTLYRNGARAGRAQGSEPYLVKPPLGSEQLIVLFSSAPLDSLFPKGATSRELGSDPDAAAGLVQALQQLGDEHILVAQRRYDLTIAAKPGGTEYTTRGIVRTVREASAGGSSPGAATRIPSRIEFEFDSDHLTDQGKLDLDTFGEALASDLRDSTVMLEGHTDAVGTDDYNMNLSERRAAAAKQYLIDSFGIAASRLTTLGMGKSNPIASNDDAAGRSQNRRVDFTFSAAH
jgi:outer membrane protein OmpA-like peptidoglycan-associated protein